MIALSVLVHFLFLFLFFGRQKSQFQKTWLAKVRYFNLARGLSLPQSPFLLYVLCHWREHTTCRPCSLSIAKIGLVVDLCWFLFISALQVTSRSPYPLGCIFTRGFPDSLSSLLLSLGLLPLITLIFIVTSYSWSGPQILDNYSPRQFHDEKMLTIWEIWLRIRWGG